jgi:hypothetical protein
MLQTKSGYMLVLCLATFRPKGSLGLRLAIAAPVSLCVVRAVAHTSVSLMAAPTFEGEALLLAVRDLLQAGHAIGGHRRANLIVGGLHWAALAVGKLPWPKNFWRVLRLGLPGAARMILSCLFIEGIILPFDKLGSLKIESDALRICSLRPCYKA